MIEEPPKPVEEAPPAEETTPRQSQVGRAFGGATKATLGGIIVALIIVIGLYSYLQAAKKKK